MKTVLQKHPASLFDTFFGEVAQPRSTGAGSFEIAVKKNENEYRIVAHLPGLKKEDLTLEIKDDLLTIAGKAAGAGDGQFQTVYSELPGRSEYRRQIRIDAARFDTDHVSAKIENGVLEVVLPVRPEEQPRQIQVQ